MEEMDAARLAQANISLLKVDAINSLAELRKRMVRQAAQSKSARRILAENGHDISDEEIEYVRELDKKAV